MNKLLSVIIMLALGSKLLWAAKPENYINFLYKGASIAEVKTILGQEDFSQLLKPSDRRMLMYNLLANSGGRVEYNLYFTNGVLEECTKRLNNRSSEIPVWIVDMDSLINVNFMKENICVSHTFLDVDEKITIINNTDLEESFMVFLMGGTNNWIFFGETPLLSANESYIFPYRMDRYTQFEKPLVQVAIVAQSGKYLSMKLNKSDYDLVIDVQQSLNSESKAQTNDSLDKDEIIRRLNTLKELLDSGIISETEYKEARIKLLSTI